MKINSQLLLAQGIYYGSFLVFPFLGALYYYRHELPSGIAIGLAILAVIFIWSRFIETQIIVTKETPIKAKFATTIALIADTHLGVYKQANFLKRVVQKINKQNVDYVFIAGDFTHEPHHHELDKLFSTLKTLNKPVYAVLGNHDVQNSARFIRGSLEAVLKENNVRILNNEIVSLNNFTLVGLGDTWGHEDDITILKTVATTKNIVVLSHNPDVTLKYTERIVDFTLVGHTHGGQIRIPFLYRKMIPTEGKFDRGLTHEPFTKLFITAGLGETGLPMRLFNPPTIDILRFEKD